MVTSVWSHVTDCVSTVCATIEHGHGSSDSAHCLFIILSVCLWMPPVCSITMVTMLQVENIVSLASSGNSVYPDRTVPYPDVTDSEVGELSCHLSRTV